jgi:hypothetical protein
MKFIEFLKSDNTWFGLCVGAIAPVFGYYFYYQLVFADHMSLKQFTNFVHTPDLMSKVLSLSVLMNLPLFFYFIRKRRDYSAKGVLGATLVYAAVIAYLKFF